MAANPNYLFPNDTAVHDKYWSVVQSGDLISSRKPDADALRMRLSAFAGLPSGWDSYGALPISRDAREAAYTTVENLLQYGVSMPYLVPTPNGGVQAEWHSESKVLELEFHSSTIIEMFYRDSVADYEEELAIDVDFDPIYRRASEFSTRQY